MVVRGGVAPNFELSAPLQSRATHSNRGLKRNILPPGLGFRLQVTHGFPWHAADGQRLRRINFQARKDFGREEF